ncbi:MAG: hypothetical protein KJZ75_13150 [Hyphomonadaceae bacterium]|nr:hypothetical protein [Hyphomonadaceae bacterium]
MAPMRWMAAILAAALAGCSAELPRYEEREALTLLRQYSNGAAPFNVCTAEGRAQLRGAVRAYSRAREAAGEVWPDVPSEESSRAELSALDISMLIAYAGGFVEGQDFQREPRRALRLAALTHLEDMVRLRGAVRTACAEVAALQRAAGRYMVEMEAMRVASDSARATPGRRQAESLRRQYERVAAAREEMRIAGVRVETRMREAE